MNKIELIDAETLYFKPIDHPKMLIEGILSNGLAILSGDSKIGKSWMVLWFCLKLAKGEPIWGLPTAKTNVAYLALEDKDWRVQNRLQKLTEDPPNNLRLGFSCGKIGEELELQIEDALKDYPDTGILFIDTLQMVRDNVSSKTNAYAQDYRDLSALKKIADNHNMCIFLVHHNRKERDGSNIFNDMSGSTGIMGVADTCMILRKEERFENRATLSITGRDVEERQLKLVMNTNVWEVTEELSAADLRKEKVQDFIFQVVNMLLTEREFIGTVSELLSLVNETTLQPNVASKYITKYYSDILKPMGIRYEFKRLANARQLTLYFTDDGNDGTDAYSGYEKLASLKAANDGVFLLPNSPSQPSFASQLEFTEVDDDEELPF